MPKRKRCGILIGISFLGLVLLAMGFAVACMTPEEQITKAKEELKQDVVQEKRYPLHDNGKNFLFVEGGEWAPAMVVLQKWVDDHPCKEINGLSSGNYGDRGWLVYYHDNEKCAAEKQGSKE